MRITAQNLIDIKPQSADFLAKLEIGDTVRGRIIELLGESISLRTASGQLFTAALMTDAELKQGQAIELLISNITDDGVFAELKTDSEQPVKLNEDVKLQQAIKQMDMKPDTANLQAAKLLLKFTMPITKENILKVVNTQKSIETMAKADIVKALALMQSEQDINNTEVTKLVRQAISLEAEGEQALKVLQQNAPEAPEAKTIEPNKADIKDIKVYKDENIEQSKAAKANPETNPVQAERKSIAEGSPNQVLKQIVELIDTEEIKKSTPKVDKLIDTIAKVFETASKTKPEHSAYLISKAVEVTPTSLKAMVENQDSIGKLGTQIKELEKLVLVLEQNKADVGELKQAVEKLFLKPEALRDKDQIQENIKEIVKTAAKLESLVRAHGLEDKVDRTILSDIKGNLDFQQNINTNINYLQLPILINENKTTADIYVFSGKKKGKTINPENASILIALDLQSLGHIESLISISKKNVNITFKVEKEQFKQVITENAEGLKRSLEARGYNLNSIQVIDIGEKFTLLGLEEVTAANLNKMHLDIKV